MALQTLHIQQFQWKCYFCVSFSVWKSVCRLWRVRLLTDVSSDIHGSCLIMGKMASHHGAKNSRVRVLDKIQSKFSRTLCIQSNVSGIVFTPRKCWGPPRAVFCGHIIINSILQTKKIQVIFGFAPGRHLLVRVLGFRKVLCNGPMSKSKRS